MKSNAIARIILYSILILLLLSVLIVGIAAGSFMFVSESVSTETATFFSANEVHNINIQWAAGDITVLPADTDYITVTVIGSENADDKTVCKQTGDTLNIQFSQSAFKIGFGSTKTYSKDLTITVPVDWYCEGLDIQCASAELIASELSANTISLSTASGECRFQNCTVNKLEAETASGNIYYSGILQYLNCDAASAKIIANFTQLPKEISVSSASGDARITLPEGSGFTAETDVLSGSFHSDFSTMEANGRYISGDGHSQITFESLSGNVEILKAD